MMQIFKEKSVAPILKKMEVSDKAIYDLSRYVTVKVTANRLSLQLDRKYRMKSIRENRVVEVVRVK